MVFIINFKLKKFFILLYGPSLLLILIMAHFVSIIDRYFEYQPLKFIMYAFLQARLLSASRSLVVFPRSG